MPNRRHEIPKLCFFPTALGVAGPPEFHDYDNACALVRQKPKQSAILLALHATQFLNVAPQASFRAFCAKPHRCCWGGTQWVWMPSKEAKGPIVLGSLSFIHRHLSLTAQSPIKWVTIPGPYRILVLLTNQEPDM